MQQRNKLAHTQPSHLRCGLRYHCLLEASKGLATILGYDDYEGWYVENFGDADARYLPKVFKFRYFYEAADFMQLVSNHCKVLNHHPDWRNVFNQATVALTTWDARRKVTIYDLSLALYMNKAAKAILKEEIGRELQNVSRRAATR